MQLRQDILFDNRYLLKKLLGSGGFSEVWLVEDTKVSHKKMALKVYAPGMGLDDHGVQLFSNEFELVFDLNHTNLLRPVYFDVCDRSPYLLMPYCEQGSVSKFAGHVTEEEAWRFLHDVAAGLAYLHAQEPPIIHQDIKPDNILKDHLGNYQITDFGISTKVRSTLRKSMMHTATSGGTMAYMPPERFGKENSPIKASDIWAMGATVFELLCGDLPFGEHGGLMQKSGAEIPNIPGLWSKELQEIIYLCLRNEPWDRPVAQQIVEWTENHCKGEKIVFQKTEKVSGFQLKNIKQYIVGCFLGLLIASVIVWYIIPSDENGKSKPTSESISIITTDKPTEPIPTNSPSSSTSPVSPVPSSPWQSEYDRLVNTASAAFSSRDYVRARTEYNRALSLANQNGDIEKATYVTGQIAACNRAIEAARRAEEEAKRQEIQNRLASYNFVGNFPLGSRYMIAQIKTTNRWGIINQEGSIVEPFNYTQVSSLLKNGYYALKNERGWVVFDTSLNKVATERENLDEYR